jgi:hypothetical protein
MRFLLVCVFEWRGKYWLQIGCRTAALDCARDYGTRRLSHIAAWKLKTREPAARHRIARCCVEDDVQEGGCEPIPEGEMGTCRAPDHHRA